MRPEGLGDNVVRVIIAEDGRKTECANAMHMPKRCLVIR